MQMLTPRSLLIKLTGLFFAAYAAYNVFVIIRDGSVMTSTAIFISVIVALMFSLLSAYALTSGLWTTKKMIPILIIRRVTFIIALLTIFALKLRMVGKVHDYLDETQLNTILYCVSYYLTLAGMLSLIIYYIFIRKVSLFYPKTSIFLPLMSAILFLCSLILEAILFFAYDILFEANLLRTVVIHPVFYLGFIGLSVCNLFPSQPRKTKLKKARRKNLNQQNNNQTDASAS